MTQWVDSANGFYMNKNNTYHQRFKSVFDRFSEKYYVCENTGCWIWTCSLFKRSFTDKDDRAAFNINKEKLQAARYSYSYYKGEIKKGMFICHHCDNKKCVNPDHLFEGTQKDNILDLVKKKLHAYGQRHGMTKLSNKIVLNIYNSELPVKKIVEKTGVPRTTVRNIKNGITWSHLTGNKKMCNYTKEKI